MLKITNTISFSILVAKKNERKKKTIDELYRKIKTFVHFINTYKNSRRKVTNFP